MRRKDREATQEEAFSLLAKGEYGVMATTDGSIPYAVPLSYAYQDNCIYFHCANEGHKLDNIQINQNVSFCVVGNTKVLPAHFSTVFESAIAFGKATVILERDEKIHALKLLIDKYSPEFQTQGMEYIHRAIDATTVVKIEIEHLSGKTRNN